MNKLFILLLLASCATICPPDQVGTPGRCIPRPTPEACDHISAQAYVDCIHVYEPLADGERLRCINHADVVFNNCKDQNANSFFSNDAVIK